METRMASPRLNETTRPAKWTRSIAPYAALVLPGGILIAFVIWATGDRSWLKAHAPLILRAVLLGSLIATGTGCGGGHVQSSAATPTVSVVTLRSTPVSLSTDLPGRVSAYRIAEVRPQVNGVILKRMFTEGEHVRSGQQLYQIDPARYEANLESAMASNMRARAAAAIAKITVERYRTLVRAHAVSRQDYDNASATLQQDEADIAATEAAVRTARIDVAYTKVYSPISGRTGRSSVTEGALVTTNQAMSLVTVTQLDPIYVDLTQPSTTLVRLKRELGSGQLQSIGATNAVAKLLLEDGSAYQSTGTLQFSEVTVDQGTGSVTLRAIFPNPGDLLLPGMFVHATIEEAVRTGAILAPQQGISHAPDGTATAFIVDSNDRIQKRMVELERAQGDRWVVTSGLTAGDRLVISGFQRIQAGTVVSVTDSTAGDSTTQVSSLALARGSQSQP
jgi:membrane fusion protein (multidrug efflux system)